MLQHALKGWRERHFCILLVLSLVVLFCIYRITLPLPVFISLGTEGDERYLRDFYFREQSELYPFRWTKDSSYIQIPHLGSLPLEITLGADAPRPEGQPLPQVSLTANGTVLADWTMQNGLRAYSFLYHPPLFSLPNDLLLEVKSDTFVPPGDASRALGIILNTVEVKPIPSPLRLLQVSLVASLIGTLSVAFGCLLLRWLGASPKKSFAGGVVALALLGFGIVRQFIVARFALGAFGLLLVGYVLAMLLEARGYREPLIARLERSWETLKAWAGNLVSVIRNPYRTYMELKRGLNAFWLRWRLDLLISVGFLIVGIAVRLPYLMLIPQITDEASEVRIALDIYRGERWPIVGNTDYLGPLHNYLLALAFRVLGVSVQMPRLYMAVLGTLTVLLTYWLGRGMAGRLVGLLAACLMAASPTHILMNSHVAWSNCSSPFFTTLMLIALYTGVRRNSGPLLVLSGFLAGLSLQTHFSVLPIFPGAVLWFLWRRDIKRWLKQPWPYLTVAFALMAYSNMIWHNAHGRLHSLAAFQKRTDQYSYSPSWSDYVTNLWGLALQLTSMMSGAMEGPDSLGVLGLWPLIVYGILLLAGLFYTFRKGHSLPLAMIAPIAVIAPYFNKDYHLPFTSRYTAPLLPLCYIAMAVPLADVLGLTAGGWSFSSVLRWAVPSVAWSKKLLKRAYFVSALLVCLVLLFYPLGSLFTYYEECMEGGNSNQLLLNIVMELREARENNVPIYLDHELKQIRRHARGLSTIASKALAYLLSLDGTDFEVIKLSETEKSPVVTSKYGWWDYPIQVIRPSDPQLPSQAMLVLMEQSYLTLQQIFELSPIIPIEPEEPRSHGSYGLYRLDGRRAFRDQLTSYLLSPPSKHDPPQCRATCSRVGKEAEAICSLRCAAQ